ncbi:unnamed protein product [Miscanthus lutarioriparius]|uniref:CCHC-type domain-containing protein n=1 Tax=Miscanthus lutarioriparius TaxID=422564 RepID=A0A811NG43_9POAL|nr:unnamed protein product [Miscanthus lutarioriparius]
MSLIVWGFRERALAGKAIEAEEEELLDWGDADEVEDIEAVQVTIDEEDSPATPDLQLRDAMEASALESGPASIAALATPRSAGSGDDERPAVANTPPSTGTASPEHSKGAPPPKLKSVMVVPGQMDASKEAEKAPLPHRAPRPKPPPIQVGVSCLERGESSGWQKAGKRRWRRMDAAPQTGDFGKMKTTAWDASRTGAQESRDALKKMLAGRCFRCLRPDHMVAQCRDPVCCLICKESGHLARHCKNRRHQPISTSLRQRLIFPSGNIHSRIAFPPLRHPTTANPPPTSLTSQPPAKIATIVASPHNVYRPSTSEVAYALSQQLHVLRHNIMVTSHKPGGFVVEFKLTPGAENIDGCTETEDIGTSFCRKMFRKKQASRSSTRRRSTTLAPTRSSLCLAACPSPVPVAHRAQQKLMRELDFINGESPAPDAAITEFVESFRQDLPEEAVKAIRVVAKLGNKELCKALAAIAAESGMAEMEFISVGEYKTVAKVLPWRIGWSFLQAGCRQRCSGCREKMFGSRFRELEDAYGLIVEAKLLWPLVVSVDCE